jgi:hypothetical protein
VADVAEVDESAIGGEVQVDRSPQRGKRHWIGAVEGLQGAHRQRAGEGGEHDALAV